VSPEWLAQEFALRGVVGGLETTQELVKGVQYLLGEALADLVLELAAVLEKRREALRAWQGEEPLLFEEQAHRGRDRPAGGLDHVRNAEIEPARAFAARRGDEAQRTAVREETRRHAGLPQQPLHAAVSRRLELTVAAHDAVEVVAGIEDPHEELPGRCAIPRLKLPDGEIRAKRLAVIRQGNLDLGRDRALGRACIASRRKTPAEDGLGEAPEVGQVRHGALFRVERALFDARAQEPLALGVAPVENRPRADEGRGGHDETRRPDEADPFAVRENFGVEPGAGHQFVSGQR